MTKYLTPWYPQYCRPEYPHQYIRFGVGNDAEPMVYRIGENEWFGLGDNGYRTAEEAMAATDKALAKFGYVFLTEEQVEKFQVLV